MEWLKADSRALAPSSMAMTIRLSGVAGSDHARDRRPAAVIGLDLTARLVRHRVLEPFDVGISSTPDADLVGQADVTSERLWEDRVGAAERAAGAAVVAVCPSGFVDAFREAAEHNLGERPIKGLS